MDIGNLANTHHVVTEEEAEVRSCQRLGEMRSWLTRVP